MDLKPYDVIVVGLGTAGSATCMALAARGVSVLGLDAASPPHQRGSHHGESRSIRRAYLEGSAYVPMALRAWELWRKLEQKTGTRLLYSTPNLTLGPVDGPALAGHGFKFAPVLGEILADVLLGKQPEFDMDMFSMNRFCKTTPV